MIAPVKLDQRLLLDLQQYAVEIGSPKQQAEAEEFILEHFAGGTQYPTRANARKAVRLFIQAYGLYSINSLLELAYPDDLPHTRISRLRGFAHLRIAQFEARIQEVHSARRHYGNHDRLKVEISDDEIFKRVKRRLDRKTVTTLQGILDYLVTVMSDRLGVNPLVIPIFTPQTIADELADVAEVLEEPAQAEPQQADASAGEPVQPTRVPLPTPEQVETRELMPEPVEKDFLFWLLPDDEIISA